MARVPIPDGPGTERSRLWQLSPTFQTAVGAFNTAVYDHCQLPVRERELVRFLIAKVNGCPVWLEWRLPPGAETAIGEDVYAAVHSYRDNPLLTDREQLVLEYAERFACDHESIDDAFMERLCAALEPVEVLELSVTIARHMGMGRITRVLRLDHDSCPLPGADSGEPRSE